MKKIHTLLPLGRNPVSGRWEAQPYNPWKTLGLIALGADSSESKLENLMVGNTCFNNMPIPLMLFMPRQAQSFSELFRKAEMRELSSELYEFQKNELPLCEVGNLVHAVTSGPVSDLVLWGYYVTGSVHETMVAKVEKTGGGYRGVVSIRDYEGEREELVVEAPGEELAKALMLSRIAEIRRRIL